MVENSFSVLMSVYRNDDPQDLKEALWSTSKNQTVQSNEIVLVVDGTITELLNENIIGLEKTFPHLKPVRLIENGGLGNAIKLAWNILQMNLLPEWIRMIFHSHIDLKNN